MRIPYDGTLKKLNVAFNLGSSIQAASRVVQIHLLPFVET